MPLLKGQSYDQLHGKCWIQNIRRTHQCISSNKKRTLRNEGPEKASRKLYLNCILKDEYGFGDERIYIKLA